MADTFDPVRERVAIVENDIRHMKEDISTLKVDVRELRTDMATVKERIAHLPTKAWAVGIALSTVGLMGAIIAIAPKLQKLVGAL